MEQVVGAGGGAGRAPPRDGAGDDVRLARDLHAGARRQRRGRDPRAAQGLRRGRRPHRDREREGLHGTPDGSRAGGRRRGQGARDRRRAAVPNFRDPDPELGTLNLSRGGVYPVRYALRLAAGFGSQISLLLLRWTPVADGLHRSADELGYAYRVADPEAWSSWLRRVSGYEEPALEVVQHRLRVADQGPSAAVTVEPERSAAPAGAPVEPSAAAPSRCRGSLPSPRRGGRAGCGSRAGRGAGAGRGGAPLDGVEERVLEIIARGDGLSAGPARHGPRPRGRPRDRHGQAGGGVRDDPRGATGSSATTR